ncbi:MAG: ATP-grasp domain-containing protein [Alphaproteobacteria bacterium]|nr:MAG: ATP-grasp domain-containing protein [Alphaproteobacteria bacterium]
MGWIENRNGKTSSAPQSCGLQLLSGIMKRVLLLLPTTSYRNEAFIAAGKKVGVEMITAADYCHRLAPGWGLDPIRAVHFDRPGEALDVVLRSLKHKPDAVLAVDDPGLELAALLNERLGLAANLPEAVRRVRDKLSFRQMQKEGGLLCPDFRHLPSDADPAELLSRLKWPVVVKARRLSGSRGVIRADNAQAYLQAVSWVKGIQNKADRDAADLGLVVEGFIPGREYALESILDHGKLNTLAWFDKPDPLDGPYFEETIYVTPSRLPNRTQEEIHHAVQHACRLAGLVTGPVHAEMRVNDEGVWLLEVAARSIGGLCGITLNHVLGITLEELILRHALNEPVELSASREGAGVMMIPIPRRGIYRGVRNLGSVLEVPGITGIRITAQAGQIIAPPPDGASYLGFIFSLCANPAEAEMALRLAHTRLLFDIQPEYKVQESISEH